MGALKKFLAPQIAYMKTASFFSSWQIISLLKYSYIRGRYRRQFVVPS
jgi:hypothetical protein